MEDIFSHTYLDTSCFGGMTLTTMQFQVPLNWKRGKKDEIITLFARKVVSNAHESKNLPYLLYLQGGPGHASPRPEGKYGWLKCAAEHYQILLLDQRGTGMSSPVTHQSMSFWPTPMEQAEYLTYFRADSIVQDCEFIRKTLLGENGKWTVLGQSFGGFCLATYLSIAPEGLNSGIFAGGLPPLHINVEEIYRKTFVKLLEYNKSFYRRYPQDVTRVRKIYNYLRTRKVVLPGGGVLTGQRFLQIGLGLGLGNFERIHYLIEAAFVRLNRPAMEQCFLLNQLVGEEVLSFPFLKGIEAMLDFESNPLYVILHESIYCEGMSSNWAAHRVLKEFKEFVVDLTDLNRPIYFTGEMMFPWMFDDYKYLQPMKMAAEILAKKEDWPNLYDIEQLKRNNVPCVAVVYHDDMYVPREFSEETAKIIQNVKVWATNEYIHSGIHSAGEPILDTLLGLLGKDCK